MTPEERGQLEASHTFKRVVELELDPVRGNFDAARLNEINRRFFQDLPGAGFDDVTPGEFRQPVRKGAEWMKHRGLSTVQGSFYVAYSRMDNVAQSRLNKACPLLPVLTVSYYLLARSAGQKRPKAEVSEAQKQTISERISPPFEKGGLRGI